MTILTLTAADMTPAQRQYLDGIRAVRPEYGFTGFRGECAVFARAHADGVTLIEHIVGPAGEVHKPRSYRT